MREVKVFHAPWKGLPREVVTSISRLNITRPIVDDEHARVVCHLQTTSCRQCQKHIKKVNWSRWCLQYFSVRYLQACSFIHPRLGCLVLPPVLQRQVRRGHYTRVFCVLRARCLRATVGRLYARKRGMSLKPLVKQLIVSSSSFSLLTARRASITLKLLPRTCDTRISATSSTHSYSASS